jgi:hypothetical protein
MSGARAKYMSEYQYYEFQAIDRPLSTSDRQQLRDLSTRAEITATSFTNSYQWGDFKGDPAKLMERWFDLHLYLANWGTRRLMMRLPAQMVDVDQIDTFLSDIDFVQHWVSGDNLIVDINRSEMEIDDWEEGSGRLADMAPLRADVLAGDLRCFYLLWLSAVEDDLVEDDEHEPMPGMGPLTASLVAFAEFFAIDLDLVHAAAERPAVTAVVSPDAVRSAIAVLPDDDKNGFLTQLFEGAPHVGVALRAEIRKRLGSDSDAAPAESRTAGELRARTEAVRLDRQRAEAEKAAAERRRQAEAAEKIRRARVETVKRRGDSVWREVEADIERRNASGYDAAAQLLQDLKSIAEERGTMDEFQRRLRAIREQHSQKVRFIERLAAIG